MPEAANGAGVPEGYSRVNPWLISADTDAEIAFLGEVFGAEERPGRMYDTEGDVAHAEIELDGFVVMMFDAKPGWPPTPGHLRIYVPDAQASVDKAAEMGARVVTRASELAFGERVARIRDGQGHLWWIHERVESLDAPEIARRFGETKFQEAMAYVQQSLVDELSRPPGGMT
jgi:PhnB protein